MSCSIVVLWLFYSCSIVVLWLFYSCPGSCTMATALRTCASGVDDDVHMRWWLHTLVWDKQTRKKERSVRRSCVPWWCLNQMVFLQRGDFLTRQSSKPERNPTTSTYYAECSPRHIWREGLDNVAIAGADLRCDFLMCVVLSLSLSLSPLPRSLPEFQCWTIRPIEICKLVPTHVRTSYNIVIGGWGLRLIITALSDCRVKNSFPGRRAVLDISTWLDLC